MGIIALAGGNEFREDCAPMDRRLLSLIPNSSARVAVIPTAAIQGSPRMAVENGVRHFKMLGATAFGVMIVTHAEANDPMLVRMLDGADMLYLAGGDPGYLLDVLRGSLLLTTIRQIHECGGIVVGSSAGAMALSQQMRVWNKGEWVSGLGLADRVRVLVHHEGPDTAILQAVTKNHEPPIVGIAEATACFSENGHEWQVAGIGSVTVYGGDSAVRYTHGQRFSL